MKFTMYHYNITVCDIERSEAFYQKAFDLTENKRKEREGYTIAFLSNENAPFSLELTCFKNHPQKYELGENETHLAFHVDDYAAAHALHKEMGAICLENEQMGLYFVEDPDGYWIEVVPEKR